ncbi:protein of unknown function [Microbacterium sp. Nx66]|nr:protein of unknown function [Microbacterium sp. Nx66]
MSCPSSSTKGAVCDGRDDDGCHVQEHGVDAGHGDDGHVGAAGLHGCLRRLRAGLHRVRDPGDGLRSGLHELRGHVSHDDAVDAPHAGDDAGHDDGDAGRLHRDVPDVHGRVHAARRSQRRLPALRSGVSGLHERLHGGPRHDDGERLTRGVRASSHDGDVEAGAPDGEDGVVEVEGDRAADRGLQRGAGAVPQRVRGAVERADDEVSGDRIRRGHERVRPSCRSRRREALLDQMQGMAGGRRRAAAAVPAHARRTLTHLEGRTAVQRRGHGDSFGSASGQSTSTGSGSRSAPDTRRNKRV